MEFKDYYKILGVDEKASAKEIKKAYRQLARKYHPDVNPNDKEAEAKFKEINEAYAVLGDKEKRKKYDEYGQYWEHADKAGAGAGAGGFPGGRGFPGGGGRRQYTTRNVNFEDLSSIFGGAGGAGGAGFSDFFNSMFGGMGGGRKSRKQRTWDFGGAGGQSGFDTSGFTGRTAGRKGADAEFPLELTIEEAAFGTKKHINFNKETPCTACNQTGMNNAGGMCQVCHGRGTVFKPRHLEVSVPPGVKNGFKIRMKNEGVPGTGGAPAGDLYLVVKIKPHSFYELKDDQLYCKVPITESEAALGAEIDVPTLNGRITMKIPAGTQSGRVFRVRGQGFPSLKNKDDRGDYYVKTKIVIPRDISDKEKKLYKELGQLHQENPREYMLK